MGQSCQSNGWRASRSIKCVAPRGQPYTGILDRVAPGFATDCASPHRFGERAGPIIWLRSLFLRNEGLWFPASGNNGIGSVAYPEGTGMQTMLENQTVDTVSTFTGAACAEGLGRRSEPLSLTRNISRTASPALGSRHCMGRTATRSPELQGGGGGSRICALAAYPGSKLTRSKQSRPAAEVHHQQVSHWFNRPSSTQLIIAKRPQLRTGHELESHTTRLEQDDCTIE